MCLGKMRFQLRIHIFFSLLRWRSSARLNSSPQSNWPRSILVSFESNMMKINEHAFAVFGRTIILLSSHVITWKNMTFPTAPRNRHWGPRAPATSPQGPPARCLRRPEEEGVAAASGPPRFREPGPTPRPWAAELTSGVKFKLFSLDSEVLPFPSHCSSIVTGLKPWHVTPALARLSVCPQIKARRPAIG